MQVIIKPLDSDNVISLAIVLWELWRTMWIGKAILCTMHKSKLQTLTISNIYLTPQIWSIFFQLEHNKCPFEIKSTYFLYFRFLCQQQKTCCKVCQEMCVWNAFQSLCEFRNCSNMTPPAGRRYFKTLWGFYQDYYVYNLLHRVATLWWTRDN